MSRRISANSSNSTSSPALLALSLAAERLYRVAFDVPRDPRSNAYKNGARAALAFRVDGVPIPHPYAPATAEDDAFYGGMAEGHALWRRAQATLAA